MKRALAFLLAAVLIADAGAAFAGGRGGHGHGRSSASVGFRSGFVHGRPFFHHGGRVIVGSAIIVGGVGYPYYYYPPAYGAPAYVEEPPVSYVEQGDQVLYYCPDSRAYYPNVTTCPSPWMKVVP
jgi:hypothetical protein